MTCCSSTVKPLVARILYGAIFLIGVALAWILRDFGDILLKHIAIWHKECGDEKCYGKQGVLRSAFTLFFFFAPLSLMMIKHRYSEGSFRTNFQNGWWYVKLPIFFGLFTLSLLLPNNMMVWFGYASIVGAAFFLFIIVVLLVDFAYDWNEKWVEREWYKAIIGVSVVIYLISAAAIIMMFIFFAPGCPLNTFFICFTLVSCIGLTYLSIREDVQRGALLTSAVVTGYCTYLCFSALLGETSEECNPFPPDGHSATWMLIIGVVIALASLIWSTVRSAHHKGFFDLRSTKNNEESAPLVGGEETEEEANSYNYSFFHFVFAVGAMYMVMLFTSWNLSSAQKQMYVEIGEASMWVKIVTQWITILLYVWSLVGPLLFPDRDWGIE